MMIQTTPSSKAILRERRIKLFFLLVSLFFLLLLIVFTDNVLISFILAIVNFYILAPFVNLLERKGLNRLWATNIPFLFLSLLIIITVSIFAPPFMDEAKTLKENFPKYLDTSSQFLISLELKSSEFLKNIYPIDIRGQLEPKILAVTTQFFKELPSYISKSLTIFFLVPLFTYFLLTDGRVVTRNLLSIVPNSFFELALNLNYQISSQLGGFIRARLIESLLVGIVIWIGLLALGFPYSLVLALVGGILNVIPYLGPLLGMLPPIIIHFANPGSPTSELIWIISIYSIAQVIDTVVLVPFLVAKIVNLHAITVILSILVGSQFMGILGMIICIPLVSTLKVTLIAIYRHFTDFRT